MRTIKFRAWATYQDTPNQKPAMIYLDPIDGFNSKDLISEDKWKVMQFTGLLDKNGKEIYEGDILKNDKYVPTWQVEWLEEDGRYWMWYLQHQNGLYLNWRKAKTLKVIGNIYENPELLKQ